MYKHVCMRHLSHIYVDTERHLQVTYLYIHRAALVYRERERERERKRERAREREIERKREKEKKRERASEGEQSQ